MAEPRDPSRRRRSTRRGSGKGLRLFVAIYPPPEIAEQMLRVARDHLDEHAAAYEGAGAQFVPAEQVHLTVHFLGNVPPRALSETIESIDRAKKGLGGFVLTPREIITLPRSTRRGRPRLIAMETDGPADLLELQRRLAQRFARPARQEPGERFWPHLTLARFKWGGGGEPLQRPAWRGFGERAAMPGAFNVREFHLVKSVLRPQGAAHQSVARWPLVTQ
ncbi:MAG: RNA 2',3'-cyclic phosphodiesterase [Phycisphaerales bacterium]|nr:RNA 2',3'-cyclic phosphodiesterase [Phycisphaerales bacterium]